MRIRRLKVLRLIPLSGVILIALLCAAQAWGAACQSSTRPATTFYVSTTGSDSNPGARTAPFRNIQTGVDCLSVPRDKLFIFGGTYTELVRVQGKNGSPGKPMVIEGQPGFAPGPVVTIQASITRLDGTQHIFNFHEGFPTAPNGEWVRATESGAHTDEYISKEALPRPPNIGINSWLVNRGAFVDKINERYTQLIPYERLADLRAPNETFEAICESPTDQRFPTDPREGPVLPDANACQALCCADCQQRRPWVYMGPGLWFDQANGHAHIRLSPTHNNVPGLADYAGETDPNKVALTIVDQNMKPLTVMGSSNVQFKRLTLHHGGETIHVENSANVAFDEVNVRAGRYGARTGHTTNLRFSNCVFDGGLPTWMFRTDLKAEYQFVVKGQTFRNGLGKQTMETLFLGNGTDTGTSFDHCEFVNAHDLYLAGTNVSFHHNLIRNLHDEALFLDGASTANGAVHHNVIEQTLSAISSASRVNIAGPWHIYRNLIDLRKPTAGTRPRRPSFDRTQVWRVDRPFKSNGVDGTYNVFQNTFIVPFQASRASGQPDYPQTLFDQMRAPIANQHKHTSLNNIFVILNREPDRDPVIATLPPQDLSGDRVSVNGNLYYRTGGGMSLFHLPILGNPQGFKTFACAPQNCFSSWHAHPFFGATQAGRPPGDEANGLLLQDPAFSNWLGEPDVADDFRLSASSPARNAGVLLPPALKALDVETSGLATPDIGAYQTSLASGFAPRLRVSVYGRRVYPEIGSGN